MDERLPLNDPSWPQMESFWRDAGQIPRMLHDLLADPDEQFDELFPQVFDSVFHEDTVKPMAYAVFPYLVEAYQALTEADRRPMVLLAQLAIAPPPDHIGLPAGVMRAMRDAMAAIEATALDRLPAPPPSVQALYYTAVSGIAFADHCCGRLLSDLLRPDGKAWTLVDCSHCQTYTKVSLFAEGAVPWPNDVEPTPPAPPRPIARLPSFQATDREPNPWSRLTPLLQQAVAVAPVDPGARQQIDVAAQLCRRGVSASVPSDQVFALLGALFVAHGYSEQAMRFFRFADEIECPSCKNRFRVADGWWACPLAAFD